jgi:hypothetical protein
VGLDWPHPYHESAAKRRANPRLRSPHDTVGAAVMGSVADAVAGCQQAAYQLRSLLAHSCWTMRSTALTEQPRHAAKANDHRSQSPARA